jgi:hypothetical protein
MKKLAFWKFSDLQKSLPRFQNAHHRLYRLPPQYMHYSKRNYVTEKTILEGKNQKQNWGSFDFSETTGKCFLAVSGFLMLLSFPFSLVYADRKEKEENETKLKEILQSNTRKV